MDKFVVSSVLSKLLLIPHAAMASSSGFQAYQADSLPNLPPLVLRVGSELLPEFNDASRFSWILNCKPIPVSNVSVASTAAGNGVRFHRSKLFDAVSFQAKSNTIKYIQSNGSKYARAKLRCTIQL